MCEVIDAGCVGICGSVFVWLFWSLSLVVLSEPIDYLFLYEFIILLKQGFISRNNLCMGLSFVLSILTCKIFSPPFGKQCFPHRPYMYLSVDIVYGGVDYNPGITRVKEFLKIGRL